MANLGKLESVHGIAPAYLQRAVIVAVLSFVFFLAMMAAFYVRKHFGYFLLSTAFLIVYIFTMSGWLMMRNYIVKIYEHGLTYRKFTAFWDEIEAVETKSAGKGRTSYEIRKKGGEKITLSEVINGLEQIINRLNAKIKLRNQP